MRDFDGSSVFAHPVVDSFERFKMFEHFKHLESNNSRLSNQDQKVGIVSDVDIKACTQMVVLLFGGGCFCQQVFRSLWPMCEVFL